MKLISICPSNTELLGYLGLAEKLVAVDNSSDWPNEILSLPRLGPDLMINMDKLQSYSPDLVLASLSVPGMERNIVELEKRNIPHIILNPNSIEDIYHDLLTVGEKTGCLSYAKDKANNFIEEINKFKQMNHSKQVGKLYWEWWPKPIFTPGKENWLTEVSEIVGGINCFSHYGSANNQVTWDEVIEQNPDVICMVWVGVKEDKMSVEAIKKRPHSSTISAVKKNRILILEEALFCRPSPRLLEGIRKLSSLLD